MSRRSLTSRRSPRRWCFSLRETVSGQVLDRAKSGPGRRGIWLAVPRVQPAPLGYVRHEGGENLSKRRKRGDEHVAVLLTESLTSLQHTGLEVLDALEQSHRVSHGAVHLQLLQLSGDPLQCHVTPLRKACAQMLCVLLAHVMACRWQSCAIASEREMSL